MPEAQFSVSKYQLIPNTGMMAANRADHGKPIFNPVLIAVRIEYDALRKRIVFLNLLVSQISVVPVKLHHFLFLVGSLSIHNHNFLSAHDVPSLMIERPDPIIT